MKIVVSVTVFLATVALGLMEDMIRGTICQGKIGMDLEVCYSNIACKYMNQIHQRNGVPPMQLGTEAMLKNSMHRSKVQSRRGSLFHQSMEVKICSGKCTTTLSAENVALFQYLGINNPAAQCKWRYSPGHFRNVISTTSNVCAIGIYNDSSDSWWCNQTFS